MVPLRDNNPTRIVPVVTYAIIAINIAVFVYELSLGPQQLESFFRVWAIVPRALTASFAGEPTGLPFPAWVTLFTSQFLHGGFLHIAGNMLFLWIFGNNVEDKLGHVRFLIFYLACGVLAGLAQWFFSAYSAIPSLGASGAIAGVMGAYILRFPQAEILTLVPLGFFMWTFRVPAFFFLGFWFAQQALYSFASLNVPTNVGMQNGGIAYWAHAGGFVFGAILGPLLGLFSDRSNEY
ncbi:rhomboid family intramembrane serine protease [Altericista sp. CCNU0014]|uniref:rhomboid family intramembrane serine protease n=1 Tax=Altericista sp. CCNU0014 TaxID=3082949 RepID=UPI00384EDCD5